MPSSDWRVKGRTERFEFRTFDLNLKQIGTLDGWETCQLNGSVFNDVRWGGTMEWSGRVQPNWSQILIQPWYFVTESGFPDGWALSPPMYCKVPTTVVSDAVPARVSVELYDVTYSLARRIKLQQQTTIADGVNLVSTLTSRLTAAGVQNFTIVPSAKTLAAALNFDVATSEMVVDNALLTALGYWSLYADLNGGLVGAPYQDPASRPVAYTFLPGESIMSPDETLTLDDWDVPNRITGVPRVVDGATVTPVTVTLDTIRPSSKYTNAARGYWVDAEPLLDVDAADSTALTATLTQALLDLNSPVETRSVTHAWVPEARLGSVVLDSETGIRYTEQSQSISIETGLQTKTEWRRV